jgi:hypothetical protein
MNIHEWTKRLGQQHWSQRGESTTLCGMPMLGNNYANHLQQSDKTPCSRCIDVIITEKHHA